MPAAWGRKPLQKPVAEIVDDIQRQRARRAIFVDLNLIADKHYAARLFEALIPLRLQWYGLATTLLCYDEELLDLVARSGCRGLLMGLESISPDNLRSSSSSSSSSSSKAFNDPARYPEVVEKLHQRGIALQGCFVFGLDHDTPDVFMKTAKFAVDAKIDLPRFAIVTPFPGTQLYREFDQQGRIITNNWELYDGQHVVFQPAQMTVEQLQRGTENAWKHAYSSMNIVRRLRHTAAPWHVAVMTNLGYRYYAHRLNRFYTCDWMLNPVPTGDGSAGPPNHRTEAGSDVVPTASTSDTLP
ncbi:MAG: hypothetical protein ABGZ24_13115 [Fuerstiella sp.]